MDEMVGKKAPHFLLPGDDGRTHSPEDFRGVWLVLYFYPRDNTSGCTLEATQFTENLEEFQRHGATVVGISPDSTDSHRRFRERHGLKVLLLSDPEKRVLEAYGVWKLKRMYGREYYGVERSTFLIDPEGTIRRVWRKVKVRGHVEEVLEALKSSKGS